MIGAPAIGALVAATWPAAETCAIGPLTLRRSPGGGPLAQAACCQGPDLPDARQLTEARTVMAGWEQPALFRIDQGQTALDALLDAANYLRCDPMVLHIGPLPRMDLPPVTGFALWPPLAMMEELWLETGQEAGSIDVMNRVDAPKTAILGRHEDRAAAVAFVAATGDTAAVHALDVAPAMRRQGMGRLMIGHAARWAARQGLTRIAALIAADNTAARNLCEDLGMTAAGGCHYRQLDLSPGNGRAKAVM